MNRNPDGTFENTAMEWRMKQRCSEHDIVGTCCEKHRWALNGQVFKPSGKIISSPAFEEALCNAMTPKDGAGNHLVSTKRGRRRAAKKEGK